MNAAGCTATTSTGAATVVPNGFTAQLPSGALPPGFFAVANVPGGGASRNVRRPDLIPGVSPYLNNDRNLLNPAAFAIPAPGTFGNLSRNALRGPNFWQSDLIFNKRIPITETVRLEFRTEIFNLFNHANFALPSSTLNVGLPTISSAGQLGPNSVQPGQGYTQSIAGSAFGLLRQTVERTVGSGHEQADTVRAPADVLKTDEFKFRVAGSKFEARALNFEPATLNLKLIRGSECQKRVVPAPARHSSLVTRHSTFTTTGV